MKLSLLCAVDCALYVWKKPIAVLALLLAPTVVHAWTTADTYREAGYDALLVLDAKQTSWAMSHPGWQELNPLLGSHPSQAQINRHFIACALLHGVVSGVLPEKYRSRWQWSTIGIEAFVVAHNKYIGIRMSF